MHKLHQTNRTTKFCRNPSDTFCCTQEGNKCTGPLAKSHVQYTSSFCYFHYPYTAQQHPNTHVSVCVYLSTYPLRTPLSWGSGGGCHWTIIDWFVRPLATIFFGGALGASSLSMSLTHTDRRKEREGHRKIIMNRVY